MANHDLPTLTSTYTNVLTQLDDRFDDQAKMFDPATVTTTVTGVPTNTIRWNSSSDNWTKFNGSSWVALSSLYAISVSGTAANVTGTVAVANGGTGGTTAATARTNLGLGSLAVLNTVNDSNWSGTDLAIVNGGTGASDASTALTNLGVSTYAKTLLDDTSASAALSTLGVSEYAKTLLDDADASATLTTLGVSTYVKTLLDDVDAPTARQTLGIPNSGPLSGLRNLIINGDFRINQRGYVSGTATTTANQYTVDRWRVVTSGQNITLASSGNGFIVTAPSGGLEQVIEGSSIASGTYTINWTGTATCTVGGTARVKGASFSVAANTNLTVRFSSGTVSQVQLEQGNVATAFEVRPTGLELLLCQRYFWLLTGGVRVQGYAGGAGGNTYQTIRHPVTMRAVPTLTSTFATPVNCTATLIEISTTGFQVSITSLAALDYASVLNALSASAEL